KGGGEAELFESRRLGRDDSEDTVPAALLVVEVRPKACDAGECIAKIQLPAVAQQPALFVRQDREDHLLRDRRIDRLPLGIEEAPVRAMAQRGSAMHVDVAHSRARGGL